MNASMQINRARRNGERRDRPAIVPGMSVMDAAYHTAQAYPGGVAALALRMGVSPNTLQHKLNINNATHHLTLAESEALQVLSGDSRITQAMAAAVGGVYLEQQVDTHASPMEQAMSMVHEFGEVLTTVTTAMADGVVTHNELLNCEREVAELMSALNTTLGVVRSMMPKEPQA